MPTTVFIDVETTGLDPARHELWEIALIVRQDGEPDAEYAWQVRPDLATAEPGALRIGGYRDRCQVAWQPAGTVVTVAAPSGTEEVTTATALAGLLAQLLDGAVLAGINVAFDRDFTAAFLVRNGEILTADYHLIETCSLAAGWLAHAGQPVQPPWRSDDLARAAGINPRAYDRHTALGDAQYARDMFDAATGTTSAAILAADRELGIERCRDGCRSIDMVNTRVSDIDSDSFTCHACRGYVCLSCGRTPVADLMTMCARCGNRLAEELAADDMEDL